MGKYRTDHVKPSGPPDRIPAYNDSGDRLHLNGKPAFTDELGPKTKATTKKKHKNRPEDGSSRLEVNQ